MNDGGAPTPRGAPLLITAELPPDVFAWADGLRRTHYPPERNRLGAHVTLIHGLPPSAGPVVQALLPELVRRSPPEARIVGLMDLDRGTAFAVDSPDMVELHGELAERLHGLIQQKDARPLKLHITIQNKVTPAAARSLQAELAQAFQSRAFRFPSLGLHAWQNELWKRTRGYAFRA